jgi:hypothetical protein
MPKMVHKDMTHQDELKMSTPFSEVATWERLVLGQLLTGRSFLRGPPGMWEKFEPQIAAMTAQEKTSMYFDLGQQMRIALGRQK